MRFVKSGPPTVVFDIQFDASTLIVDILQNLAEKNEVEVGAIVLPFNENNDYISSYIKNENEVVFTIRDDNEDLHMNVLEIKGFVDKLPSKLLVNTSSWRVDDIVKALHSFLKNNADITLFHERTKQFLIPSETLSESDINDDDSDTIFVFRNIEGGTLAVTNITESNQTVPVEYETKMRVDKFLIQVRKEYNLDKRELIALFLGNMFMNENSYMFHYHITEKSYATMMNYISWEKIQLSKNTMDARGDNCEIYYGELDLGSVKKPVAVKHYDKCSKGLCRELAVFTKSNTEPCRFVVQLLGFAKCDNKFRIAMDWMDGGNLTEYVKRTNYERLAEAEIARITDQIIQGLQHLHGDKIILRNLRGRSVLLDNAKNVRLSSFSVARSYDSSDDLKSGTKGSILKFNRWMAPELLVKIPKHRYASDVWSLGATIIEMLNGVGPFSNIQEKDLKKHIRDAKALPAVTNLKNPDEIISDALEKFISICGHGDPETRPSLAELRRDPFLIGHGVGQS